MRRVLAVLLLLLLAPATASGASISGPGSTSVTLVAGGERILATWMESGPTSGRVRARLLDSRGTPMGPARTVASTGPGSAPRTAPAAVWDERRRRFLLAFRATGRGELSRPCPVGTYEIPPAGCRESDVEISARVVDRRGAPRGPVRRLTRTGGRGPNLFGADAPGLAVDRRSGEVWFSHVAHVGASGGRVLRVQRLTPDGVLRGAVRRIGPNPDASGGGITAARIASRARGGLLAVYDLSFTVIDLLSQPLSPRGAPEGDPVVLAPRYAQAPYSNFTPQPNVAAVLTHPRGGNTLVAWQRCCFGPGSGYSTRLLDAAGRPATEPHDVSTSATWRQLAVAPAGTGWAAVFTRYTGGVHVRALSGTGRGAGAARRLDTGPGDAADPAVATTARGRVVAAWSQGGTIRTLRVR
jgi:hypothetical protein